MAQAITFRAFGAKTTDKIRMKGLPKMKRLLVTVLACSMIAGSTLPQVFAQDRSAASVTLIQNATVLTVTRGTLTNTDVLIRNGKIAAVGKNLKSPGANTRVIDAT